MRVTEEQLISRGRMRAFWRAREKEDGGETSKDELLPLR